MSELNGITAASLGTRVISGALAKAFASSEAIASGEKHSGAAATVAISQMLRGQVAQSRQVIRNINDAISMVQTFDASAGQISDRLIQMQTLATQTATGTYSDEQKAILQNQFLELAADINLIAESTQFNGNKLLNDDGKMIEISIGNGSLVEISAANLGIDTANVDLINNSDGALALIREAIEEQVSSYRGYLGSQSSRLVSARSVAEIEVQSAMEVYSALKSTDAAKEVATYSASQIAAETAVAMQAQANATVSVNMLE